MDEDEAMVGNETVPNHRMNELVKEEQTQIEDH